MSDKEETQDVSANGKKKAKGPKIQPAFKTEAEMRAVTQPAKSKPYCVVLGDEKRYIWGVGPARAMLDTAIALGMVAKRLDKAANPDAIYAEVMSLPPDHLKELVARINASAHIAGATPTAGAKKK